MQTSLTIDNVEGIFYILLGGLSISIIVAILDLAFRCYRESVRDKVSESFLILSGARNFAPFCIFCIIRLAFLPYLLPLILYFSIQVCLAIIHCMTYSLWVI